MLIIQTHKIKRFVRRNVLLLSLIALVAIAILFALTKNSSPAIWREWISATSGWAAAGVAGYTIKILVSQLKSQQDQTAFLIGDAPPTFDAFQEFYGKHRIIVHIRNWNRRTMFLNSVSIIGPTSLGFTGYQFAEPEGPVCVFDAKRIIYFTSEERLLGWFQREQAPLQRRVRFIASLDSNTIANHSQWQDAILEFAYSFVDSDEVKTKQVHIYKGTATDLEITENGTK